MMVPNLGPGVHFDAIKISWQILNRQAGTWVVAALLVIVVQYAISILASLIINGSMLTNPAMMFGASSTDLILSPWYWVRIGAGSFVNAAFDGILGAGFILFAVDVIDGRPADYGRIFAPFKRFLPCVLVALGVGLAATVGFYLCVLPGLYLLGRLMFAVTYCADNDGVSANDSLERVWNYMGPYAFAMAGLILLLAIIAYLGFCACIVGALITVPLAGIVVALHYMWNFRQPQPWSDPAATVDYPR